MSTNECSSDESECNESSDSEYNEEPDFSCPEFEDDPWSYTEKYPGFQGWMRDYPKSKTFAKLLLGTTHENHVVNITRYGDIISAISHKDNYAHTKIDYTREEFMQILEHLNEMVKYPADDTKGNMAKKELNSI